MSDLKNLTKIVIQPDPMANAFIVSWDNCPGPQVVKTRKEVMDLVAAIISKPSPVFQALSFGR